MNTRNQQMADIREACIKANPEIEKRELPEMSDSSFPWPEIRLADVLLAILAVNPANRTNILVESGGLIKQMEWSDDDRYVYKSGADYNLRADDLTQQSDECIEFISSLLNA